MIMQYIPCLLSVPSHRGPIRSILRGVLLTSVLFIAACASDGGGSSSAGSGVGPAPGLGSSEPNIITLSQYTASDVLRGFSIHTLKPDGAPVHISYYNPAGALLNYTTYEYDTRNRQTRIGFYNATGGLLWYGTYCYEGSARAPHYHGFYSANGTLVRYEAYAYDDEGQLSYHGFYDAAANLTRYAFYNYTAFPDRNGTTRIDFYNALGNLTGVEIRQLDAAGRHNRTGFYNANGELIRYTVSIYADGTLRYVATYTAADELMFWDSYGYDDASPLQTQPPRPAVNPRTDVMPVPDARRPQPPEDPPARAPAQDTNAPPARTPPTPAILDGDDDDLPDVIDNCPIKDNRAQADADMDSIGDACEAEAVLNLAAAPDGTTAVNLSWVNPSEANLTVLNISYQRRDGMGDPMVVALTQNLTAGVAVRYRVADLSNGTTYTFTVGGFDIQHGRIGQLLPLASINATTQAGRATLADRDGDGVPNDEDNCPFVANAQDDPDGDNIGEACEAVRVSSLRAVADDWDKVTLSWTNPTRSDLVAMNISYGPTDDPDNRTEVDLTAEVELAAGAVVRYQVMDLAANTTYTFMVGGIDFRQGRLNQTLPPASITETTLPDTDGDGLADGADNCPRVANNQDDDDDGDGIGDACEAESVLNLAAVADAETTSVNLSWINPADSVLREMTITYRVVGSTEDPTVIDITAQVNRSAGVATFYVVGKERLMGSKNYTFTIGGIDARHGLRAQTLPPASIHQTTAPDGDGDGTADAADNCPRVTNNNQNDNNGVNDGDGIGDACEAEGVADLTARTNNLNTVNLSWMNPEDGVLLALNITYWPTADSNEQTEIDITAAVPLGAGAVVRYQVMGLTADTNYTFRVDGIDFRHGRRNQTLPPRSVSAVTNDADGDGIVDAADNCPRVASNNQNDDNDGDGIGDACEAVGVSDLAVVGLRPATITLRWTNPIDSDLQELNISYGLVASPTRTVRVLPATVNLAAGASVLYRVTGLSANMSYMFTLGGIDFRHGRRNQTLPPVSVSATTRYSDDADGDGIRDGMDNCLFTPNTAQTDTDMDSYGDACGPDYNNDGVREIQTAAQLNAVRNNLTAQYELITDIDLSNYTNWNPISTFSGVLDGKGYTIANLSIAGTRSVGLFGRVADGTIIRNTILRVSNIRTSSIQREFAGGLVGDGPSAGSGANIRDVAVIVEGNISANGDDAYVGGIVGRGVVNMATSYVVVMGEISGTGFEDTDAGGLVGWLRGGALQNSYALVLSGGAIKSSGSGTDAGGLVGYRNGGMLSNSYAVINGTISASNLGALIGFGSATSSYFAAPGSVRGSGTSRTLQQMTCPTNANRNCTGATTYTGWDNATIWDFGDNETLPDLRSNRRPAYINELLP